MSWLLVALGVLLVAVVAALLVRRRSRRESPGTYTVHHVAKAMPRFDQPVAPANPGPAQEAIRRYERGSEIHPLGAAVLRVAFDWGRLGFGPISRRLMFDLAPAYLPDPPPVHEDEASALAWAGAEFDGGARLLERVAGDRHRVTLAISEHFATRFPDVPAPIWAVAVRESAGDPAVATSAGEVASKTGRLDLAAQLWGGAAAHDGLAAFNLGVLRQDEGDLDAAAAAYRQAIDSGDVEQAPKAAYNLGGIRAEQGDLDAAAAAWQLAVESGHPEHAPDAAMDLGNLHAQQGDYPAAVAAFRTVADSGPSGHAPQALVNIGIVHQVTGDLAAAATAYRRAIESGRAEVVHRARALLADLPDAT